LTKLSEMDLLIIDDFRTVGIDPDAASDLFAILAGRGHRRPTMIASQSGPITGPERCPTESPPTPSSTGSPTTPERSTSAKSTCADNETKTPEPQRDSGNGSPDNRVATTPGSRYPVIGTPLPTTRTSATNERYAPGRPRS
jgi:hypothetical protein